MCETQGFIMVMLGIVIASFPWALYCTYKAIQFRNNLKLIVHLQSKGE